MSGRGVRPPGRMQPRLRPRSALLTVRIVAEGVVAVALAARAPGGAGACVARRARSPRRRRVVHGRERQLRSPARSTRRSRPSDRLRSRAFRGRIRVDGTVLFGLSLWTRRRAALCRRIPCHWCASRTASGSLLLGYPAADAEQRQISVGGVAIGGGAPVVVQSMTLTKTHDVEATTAQIAALASAGCEVVRVAVPKNEDAEALPSDRPSLAAPGDRGHPLQREPRAQGDRGRRRRRADQPGEHRRRRQGRARRRRGQARRDPDADRRELRLAAEAPRRPGPAGPGRGARRGRARGGPPPGAARLPRLQDLRQVEPRADDDPRLPDALREGAVPAPPRRHRGGHPVQRLDQERRRHGRAARRRDRRHDARLAHRRPGRGGSGRLGDPQGARPPRARAR